MAVVEMLSLQRSILVIGALLVVPAGGCGLGTCSLGDSYCDGTTPVSCSAGSDFGNFWYNGNDCDFACKVLPGLGASCVGSKDSVPACAQDGPVCWNGGTSSCVGGYPLQPTACGAGTSCVAVPGCGAVCAIGAADPSCMIGTPDIPVGICDGDGNVAQCACGYVVEQDADCGGAGLCHVGSQGPFCAESATPDQRCGDPSQDSSSFCNGHMENFCSRGYVFANAECTNGQTCTMVNGVATCALPD